MSLKRVESFFLFLLILLLPTQLGIHFWPAASFINGLRIDYLSPTIYLTDILILALLICWSLRHFTPTPKFSRHLWPIIFLFALLLLNLLTSSSIHTTLTSLLRLGIYIFFVTYLSTLSALKSQISRPLSLAILWVSLLAILHFFSQSSIGGPWYWLGERTFTSTTPAIALAKYPTLSPDPSSWPLLLRPYSTFSHPNSLAGFLLVCLILIWSSKSRQAFVAKIFGSVALLLTLSRPALLIGALLLLLHSTHLKKPVLAMLSIGLVLLTLLYSFFALSQDYQPLSSRNYLNQIALGLISSHPLTGVGLGNFVPSSVNLSKELPPSIPVSPQLAYQPVHNIYLLLTTELGLPLSILAFYLIIKSLKHLITRRDPTHILAFLSILITGLFDHYWLTLHQNQLLLLLILGLTWSSHPVSKKVK